MKKIFYKIFSLLLVLCLSFVISGSNVQATTLTKYVPKSTGGYVTYERTDIKVEIPTEYVAPKTEYRGVWVSCFAGDITGFKTTKEAFQGELLNVLNTMEEYNLNTIVFHIRTHNDAFYDTKLAPLSNYMSAANFKEWDYLEWFIDECHSRGIEFHAWLNPYRISSSSTTMSAIKTKYANYRNNPAYNEENVLISESGAILDPGRPAVREYLVDVCMEIIEKYDIDAIHFDDYFYLAGVNDNETYSKYKANYGINVSKADFRRLQVDEFIEDLSNEMKKYNEANGRAVQLGISPSGIYRNGGGNKGTTEYVYDKNGTLTSPVLANTNGGYAHYDSPLYSDTKKWVDEEWIDYITPQLYGSFENKNMKYADVLDWWDAVVKYKDVNLYAGIGIYQISGTSDAGWYTSGMETFCNSLLYNQTKENVDGFCLYQYRTLEHQATKPDIKKAKETILTTKALNPVTPRYSLKVDKVQEVSLIKGNGNYTIKYEPVATGKRYAIYKSSGTINVDDPTQLIAIIGEKEINTYIDYESGNANYGIVTINQANQTSDIVVLNSSNAVTEIDFDFGAIDDLTFTGEVKANAYLNLMIYQADIYVGGEITYTLYSSTNQKDWTELRQLKQFDNLSYRVNVKFNDYLSPMFFKVVIENEFGQVESKILKIDYKQVKPDECLEYIIGTINKDFEEVFALGE